MAPPTMGQQDTHGPHTPEGHLGPTPESIANPLSGSLTGGSGRRRRHGSGHGHGHAPSHESAEMRHVRRFLSQVYAKYGMAGVLRALPPDAHAELGVPRGAGSHSPVARWLADVFANPETMLFVLLCVFALFVAWDSWSSATAVHSATVLGVPDLPTLHMSPFSFGTGP